MGFLVFPFFLQISWKFFQLQLRNDDQNFLSCNWSPHHVNSKSGVGHFLSTCCWLSFSIASQLSWNWRLKTQHIFLLLYQNWRQQSSRLKNLEKWSESLCRNIFLKHDGPRASAKKILYILDEHITYPRNRALKLLIQIEKWAALFFAACSLATLVGKICPCP